MSLLLLLQASLLLGHLLLDLCPASQAAFTYLLHGMLLASVCEAALASVRLCCPSGVEFVDSTTKNTVAPVTDIFTVHTLEVLAAAFILACECLVLCPPLFWLERPEVTGAGTRCEQPQCEQPRLLSRPEVTGAGTRREQPQGNVGKN